MKKNSQNPQVSIIMPAYNAEATIFDSILSVTKQTYVNWELIIINDGSIDKTVNAVKNFLDDERLVYIEQSNSGISAARNSGILASKGEFIAFLDADDLWVENKLELQMAEFANLGADYGLIHSQKFTFDSSIENSYIKDDAGFLELTNDRNRLLVHDFISTLTVIIRRSVVEDIGLFDINLNGTEDWDFWIRTSELYKIKYIEKRLAYYRININGISQKNKMLHLLEHKKVIDKHKHHMSPVVYELSIWFYYKKYLNVCLADKRLCAFKCVYSLFKNATLKHNICELGRIVKKYLR